MRFLSRRATGGRPVRLRLEVLEDRAVPATVSFVNGTLSISAIKNSTLAVNQNANGTFSVLDGGSSNGTYSVTNGITITLGNKLVNTKVQMIAGGVLHGNLTVNGGNSQSFIQVNGATGTTPTILGSVIVNAGYGNFIGINSADSSNNSLNISGDTTVNSTFGATSVVVGIPMSSAGVFDFGATGTNTTLRGNLNLHAVTSLVLGDGGYPATVRGNVLADMQQSGTSTVTINAASTDFFSTDTVVRGTVSITNTLNDLSVVLQGTVGATTLTGGSSSNNYLLNGTVNGTLNASVGAGTSTITQGSLLQIVGSSSDLIVNVAGGTNTYDFGGSFPVGRNFVLNALADNSDNTITFGGTVGTSVQFNLGSGNNVVTFSSVNPNVSFNATTGKNNITVNTGTAVNHTVVTVTSQSATGGNTLTFNGSGVVTGSASSLGGFLTDTYNPGAANTVGFDRTQW